MSNRKPLSRGQWIAISAIVVPAVLVIIGWFTVSPSKPKQSQNTVIGSGSGTANSVIGNQNIIGNDNVSGNNVNGNQNITGNNNTTPPSPQSPSKLAAKPAPKKNTSLKSQSTFEGSLNVTGNNVSGNGNVTGNGNQVDQSVGQTVQAYAPNGIAISGGNVNNPTVNNYGPPTPPPAVIHICESKSTPDNTGAIYQVFTLITDSKVEAPRYDLWFDGVLPKGTSASSPDMAVNIREGQSDSRYGFQILQTWYPGQRINVEVYSATPIQLIKESGEHGESFVLSSSGCGSGL